ncbi:ACT domain-containing protein [Amycolatopsis acidiphila]|uniref:ACT domain-containing protein n=1 Tax=Amycolatopsis acidiphila TaxID=715473 RepID=A0A557ZN39_9PSEU|nr:ACT domain-containing protein [Amycolatopsis acidiphila]TVT13444.1 ACT domain-containing protein [Amycolatopsis acidiphila]UIJ62114.1 ACT domain-containing protein [Amycolatopsis acidiphila]GHG91935.1 amino acid-binding protein [Amycolatopsis acidiphila]
MKRLAIDVQPGEYVLARLEPDAGVPADLLAPGRSGLVSVTRTAGELSVVCPAGHAPEGAKVEAGWRLLTVRGPLAFTLTGIIAALANELASAGVALVTLSTFDTDHVLVKQGDLARAVDALNSAGHEVHLPA